MSKVAWFSCGAVKDKKTGLITCQYCMYRKKGGNYMPYVIRNCPARLPSGFCIEAPKKKAYLCKDCTDCVPKQIVELCKHYKKYSDCGRDCPSFGSFLNKLLDKLDIQECE